MELKYRKSTIFHWIRIYYAIFLIYLCLPLYQFLNHLRGQVAQAPLHWQPSPYLGLLQRFHSLLQTPASFRPSCIYPNPAMSCGLLWHNQVLEGCPECFLESYLVYFWKLAEILLPSHFLALNWKEPPPWMRRSCTSLWQGGIPVVVALRVCISIHASVDSLLHFPNVDNVISLSPSLERE